MVFDTRDISLALDSTEAGNELAPLPASEAVGNILRCAELSAQEAAAAVAFESTPLTNASASSSEVPEAAEPGMRM